MVNNPVSFNCLKNKYLKPVHMNVIFRIGQKSRAKDFVNFQAHLQGKQIDR